jgi:hypothetical protein
MTQRSVPLLGLSAENIPILTMTPFIKQKYFWPFNAHSIKKLPPTLLIIVFLVLMADEVRVLANPTLINVPTVYAQDNSVPVTSYRIDLNDDPENTYSESPKFDWKFFGDRTRLLARFSLATPLLRDLLEDNFIVDCVILDNFSVPVKWPWMHGPITGKPYK